MESKDINISFQQGRHFVSPRREAEAPREVAPGSQVSFVSRLLDGVITLSLAAIFFGLPIFFLGTTLQGLAFEKQIYFYFWLLLALVAWITKGVIVGEMKIRRTPLDVPILIFWVVYALSAIFSVDRWHSFWGSFGDPSRGLLGVTALIVTYFIIASHFSEKRFQKILGALVFSGALASLWVFLGVRGVNFLPSRILEMMSVSPMISMSNFGIFLEMLIPVTIVMIFRVGMKNQIGNIGRLFRVPTIVALFLTLAFEIFLVYLFYNYTPWYGLAIGMGFILIYIVSTIVRPGKWAWLPMLAAAIIIVLWWGFGPLNNKSFKKIVKIELPAEIVRSQEFGLTLETAKNSLGGGFKQFVLGSGPANYGHGFSLFKPQSFNNNFFYGTRLARGGSLLLESLVTVGALGTIAITILILSFISVGVYLLSREKEKNKVYSLGLFTAALVVMIDGTLSRIDGPIFLLGALMAAIASVVILEESNSEKRFLSLSLKASPKFALALGFVVIVAGTGVALLFIFLGKILAADLYLGSAVREGKLFSKDQKEQSQALEKINKAVSLYNLEGNYFVQIGRMNMLLANSEIAKQDKANPNNIRELITLAVKFSEEGVKKMRNDVGAVESLAVIYESAGLNITQGGAASLAEAEKNYKRALELEPQNPDFYLRLGQIKMNLIVTKKDEGEKKQLVSEAKDFFRKSIEKKENFAPGYYNLAIAQKLLGEVDEAINSMSSAVILDQKNASYLLGLGQLYEGRGKDQDYKMAEALYLRVLGLAGQKNDTLKEIYLRLALIYEKMDKLAEAAKQYEALLKLIPDDQGEIRKNVQEMLDNVNRGVKNVNRESQGAPGEANGQPSSGQ
jgi:tetratricopeptide (TPR) repeat protein